MKAGLRRRASRCGPAYSVLVPGAIATIIAMRITPPVLDLLPDVEPAPLYSTSREARRSVRRGIDRRSHLREPVGQELRRTACYRPVH